MKNYAYGDARLLERAKHLLKKQLADDRLRPCERLLLAEQLDLARGQGEEAAELYESLCRDQEPPRAELEVFAEIIDDVIETHIVKLRQSLFEFEQAGALDVSAPDLGDRLERGSTSSSKYALCDARLPKRCMRLLIQHTAMEGARPTDGEWVAVTLRLRKLRRRRLTMQQIEEWSRRNGLDASRTREICGVADRAVAVHLRRLRDAVDELDRAAGSATAALLGS